MIQGSKNRIITSTTPARWRCPWLLMAVTAALWLLAGLGVAAGQVAEAANAPAPDRTANSAERLYFATGEYDCLRDWDAIIRLDDLGGGAAEGETTFTEDALLPVKQLTDSAGLALNFVHNIYVHEARNEMYVASLFTGVEPDVTLCDTRVMTLETGSVAVLANINAANGPQRLARHLYGAKTGLAQPHGVWIDQRRELLYIANTHAGNILVYENAYGVDGDLAPGRIITSPFMKAPTHLYIDEATDRMFVANFGGEIRLDPGVSYPDDGTLPSVLIFEGASTLSGAAIPAVRIVDNDGSAPDPTRLREGIAHITHNVWFDSLHNLLFVAHHTNEVLVYDLSRVGTAPPTGCLNPQRCALRPKAIIEVGADTSTQYYSAYGIFMFPELDRLYVTVGRTDLTPNSPTGYIIREGVPPNVILVYDGVSAFASAAPQPFAPTRRIHWSTGHDQYYPPQPLWVTLRPAQLSRFLPIVQNETSQTADSRRRR